jgi:hypothetical protein
MKTIQLLTEPAWTGFTAAEEGRAKIIYFFIVEV